MAFVITMLLADTSVIQIDGLSAVRVNAGSLVIAVLLGVLWALTAASTTPTALIAPALLIPLVWQFAFPDREFVLSNSHWAFGLLSLCAGIAAVYQMRAGRDDARREHVIDELMSLPGSREEIRTAPPSRLRAHITTAIAGVLLGLGALVLAGWLAEPALGSGISSTQALIAALPLAVAAFLGAISTASLFGAGLTLAAFALSHHVITLSPGDSWLVAGAQVGSLMPFATVFGILMLVLGAATGLTRSAFFLVETRWLRRS